MMRDTIFSPCRNYRYTLWRDWTCDDLFGNPSRPRHIGTRDQFVQFIGLNPSTADEWIDDPTIRRCVGYAKGWGFGALCMTNLFSIRATDPQVMLAHDEPIGPLNVHWITEVAREAALIICAWGAHGEHKGQDDAILENLQRAGVRNKLHCLSLTKAGLPAHPLYLRKDLQPIPMYD